jgi:hypothetical protein
MFSLSISRAVCTSTRSDGRKGTMSGGEWTCRVRVLAPALAMRLGALHALTGGKRLAVNNRSSVGEW